MTQSTLDSRDVPARSTLSLSRPRPQLVRDTTRVETQRIPRGGVLFQALVVLGVIALAVSFAQPAGPERSFVSSLAVVLFLSGLAVAGHPEPSTKKTSISE